ncbi:MAG: cation:proton antiporter [Dehalococcoidales bacterium]|nr:cation:proton antiporter [Dehalococcoidales bacterium]
MEGLGLVIDLSLALGAALIGGAIAHRLRQPAVLGYLAAGIAVGPHTPVIGIRPESVEDLASLGILLLMFSLGVQFSLAELGRVRSVAIYGGIAQILATMAFGAAVGVLLDYSPLVSLFFGALIALSSTVVVVKILIERGELDATHGRIMLAICLVQDLSLVPMIVVLPALAGPIEGLPRQLGVAALLAVIVLLATFILGTRLVPQILYWVAETRSRELFLITIVVIALGMAAGVSLAGLSLSLGAFLAGLVISESQFSHQTLADVLPLRDLFAVLFFVSIGMLIDPGFIVSNVAVVTVAVVAVLVGKFIIVGTIVQLFGYPLRTAIYAGLGLLQIGEFSFVLARLGEDVGVLPAEVFSLTVAVALITILVTPWTMRLAEPLFSLLTRFPGAAVMLAGPNTAQQDEHSPGISAHAVILGYGDVGQTISLVLQTRGLRQLIIDHDPHAVELARSRGLPCLYGDGGNEHLLIQANLARARVLAVTLPDPIAAQLAVTNARRINPRLDIVVRAPYPGAVQLLRNSGAREIINPAVEVSLEMTRHALHRFGVSSIEALAVVNRLRMEQNRPEEERSRVEGARARPEAERGRPEGEEEPFAPDR